MMLKLSHFASLAATATALAVSSSSSLVQASFECEKVWDQPDQGNSLTACLTDSSHMTSLARDPVRIQYGAGIVIAFLIVIFVLLCCPTVTICRYVCKCFGGYRRRPGAFCGGAPWDEVDEATKQEGYDERCRKAAVFAPWIILVACIAPMILVLRGADTTQTAYKGVFDDVASVTTFVDNQVSGIRSNLTLDNGSLMLGIDESYFTDAQSKISDLRTDLFKVRDDNEQYIKTTKTVAIVVGVVPIVFFIFNALFSFFKIRRCFPCINSGVMLFLVIIYGLVAAVLLILAFVLRDTCDEVEIYNNGRKPGIFSWYVVPFCKSNLPFESLKSTIETLIKDNAGRACDNFKNVCDPTKSTYTLADAGASDKKVFYCPTLTSGVTCTTFANVTYHLNRTSLRQAQTGVSALCTKSECTVYDCVNNCTDADVRTRANTTVTFIDFANRAVDAFNLYVAPVLDCNVLLDVALRALGSCSKIQDSTWLIGTGCLLFECYAAVSLIVIWVGQKRWFDLDDKDGDNEPFKSTVK